MTAGPITLRQLGTTRAWCTLCTLICLPLCVIEMLLFSVWATTLESVNTTVEVGLRLLSSVKIPEGAMAS